MSPILRSATRKGLPSLPAELRLMIWKATIVPRLLHITVEKIKLDKIFRPGQKQLATKTSRPSDREIHTHVRFRASEKCPVTLHICHESRMEALKYYTPSFHSSTLPLDRASSQKQTAIYFNPDLDTVHVMGEYRGRPLRFISQRTDEETIKSIRFLVINQIFTYPDSEDYGVWGEDQNDFSEMWDDLVLFERLEEIIWVFDDADTKEKAKSDRREILHEMKTFRNSLRQRGVVWKVPAVKVMGPKTLESEFWPDHS